MSSAKQKIIHPISSLSAIKNLPNRLRMLESTNSDLKSAIDELLKNNHYIIEEIQHSKNSRLELTESINQLSSSILKNDERITDIIHRLSIISQPINTTTADSVTHNTLLADNHLLDSFYVKFEDTFRGTEEAIQARQEVYLPYFEHIKVSSQKKPVLDIGCGRGEFIDLLSKNNIKIVGLDLNITMVEKVIEKGGEAYTIDALSYLRKQRSNSLSAITGFHIVEHIPFDQLLDIFNECYRVLTKDGFTLFETPNPENIIVGSCSFYMDPSHLHPIPPALLDFTMKTCGFSKTEIKRLHPIDAIEQTKNKKLNKIEERLFGPQDYAVIAHK